MPGEPQVYLDHLIGRENLRYHRADHPSSDTPTQTRPATLQLRDLQRGQAIRERLKKPDFQRATMWWDPEDCVALLESFTKDQVVPAVIMWSSETYNYVLDGAHRLSAVIAWLDDDWGDGLSVEHFQDERHAAEVRAAAREVRNLVAQRVGTFADYKAADAAFMQIVDRGGAPLRDLTDRDYARARFYRLITDGVAAFTAQWVPGDFEKAEVSFLKINKSGRKLSEWETTLVEYRDSSFARAVMSIANVSSVEYYWGRVDPDNAELVSARKEVVDGIRRLNETLLKPLPDARQTVATPRLPIIAPESRELRPARIAEFLTISEGRRGFGAETEALMERDRRATAEEILKNGRNLVNGAESMLSHVTGPSNHSLGIIPAYYFYSPSGQYIRGLLYGFLTWLTKGEEEDILARKKVLSAFRGPFELALMDLKASVVQSISRRTGSGPEVTTQAANFFDVLLATVLKSEGRIETPAFMDDIKEVLGRLRITLVSPGLSSGGRLFTPTMKRTKMMEEYFGMHYRCKVCMGALDPELGVQHDHVDMHSEGGVTSSDNQRMTHPFCNINRKAIEAIRGGTAAVHYPVFEMASGDYVVRQLSLLNDPAFFSYSRPQTE